MAISDSAKVDLLYKKFFGVTKTDTPTNKSPSNESIASPLLVRGDSVWQQASSIPGTAADLSGIVQGYQTTGRIECVSDTTAVPVGGVYPTWKTNLTDWIPPEFGSTYQVRVYVDSAAASNPVSTGTQIFADGSSNSGEWLFDYSSGVLNFIGGTIPSALTSSKKIFVTGYRYIGLKGVNTFGNLTMGNITITGNTITGNTGITFGGNITTTDTATFGNVITQGGLFWANGVNALSPTYGNTQVEAYLPTFAGNLSPSNVISTFYGNVYSNYISATTGNVISFVGTGSINLPAGNQLTRPVSATAGQFRFNTDDGAPEYYDGSNWIGITTAISTQDFYGDGGATYTLNKTTTSSGILVSINGTLQQPDVAYSVSGSLITFTENLLASDRVDIRFIAASVIATDNFNIIDTPATLVDTSAITVDSFDKLTYRGAKYTITNSNSNTHQITELLLVHNGTNSNLGTVTTTNIGSNLVTFTTSISGNLVLLQAQGSISSNSLRIQRTYFSI